MLIGSLLLVLSQAPAINEAATPLGPVAVVLTSRRRKANIIGPQVQRHLREMAAREGLGEVLAADTVTARLQDTGFGDPRACEGTRLCVLKAAEVLGPRCVLIGVDVGVIGRSLAINLEAVTADGKRTLASVELAVPAQRWARAAAPELADFMGRLKVAVTKAREPETPSPLPAPPLAEAPPPRTAADAPTRDGTTGATPSDGATAARLDRGRSADLTLDLSSDADTEQAPPRPRTGAAITTAVAGALLVTAGLLVGFGLAGKARFDKSLYTLPDGSTASRLSEAEATALASSANLQLNGAIGAGALGLTAGGVAVFLWANP